MDKKLDFMPKSDKGIAKKAEREKWNKRQRHGVRGKTFEYYAGDMPLAVQQALGFVEKEISSTSSSQDQANTKLNSADKLLSAINSLEAKIKALETPILNSVDTLNQEEKRLLSWFRKCNKDRQAMLLSSAEVLADMSLEEQKEKETI